MSGSGIRTRADSARTYGADLLLAQFRQRRDPPLVSGRSRVAGRIAARLALALVVEPTDRDGALIREDRLAEILGERDAPGRGRRHCGTAVGREGGSRRRGEGGGTGEGSCEGRRERASGSAVAIAGLAGSGVRSRAGQGSSAHEGMSTSAAMRVTLIG